MATAAINNKMTFFTSKLSVNVRKKNKVHIWRTNLYGTLRKVDHKYLERFEIWCWRRMENISSTVLVGNEVFQSAKEERNILQTVHRR